MSYPRKNKQKKIRFHSLSESPFSKSLTKKKLANLIGEPLHVLEGLIKYKEGFIVRDSTNNGSKSRPLIYPVADLRRVNVKLNYQFKKIILPYYVTCPKPGMSQRENAEIHIGANQLFKLDLKQFYPSVNRTRIAKFFREKCGISVHTAGFLTELLSADQRVFYGAPTTPILVTLIFQDMFDEIEVEVRKYNAKLSVWVDNFAISGKEIQRELIESVRGIIASHGLKSHDFELKTTNRPVWVTGVGVKKNGLVPKNSLNVEIRDLERSLRQAKMEEADPIAIKLLSKLGYKRYIVGKNTPVGQKISNRMNIIRQKRISVIGKVNRKVDVVSDVMTTSLVDPF